MENTFNIYGIDLTIDYYYSYDEGKWTLNNGDPGYPPHEEIELNTIKINDIDISEMIFDSNDIRQKIEDFISEYHENIRTGI